MNLREVFRKPATQILREGIAHPEDLIINGVVAKDSAGKNYYETRPGSESAMRAIESIASIEAAPETTSIKWDGFPAVVFGRDSEGNFVFVDKHQFDKAAKGKAELSTIEDYDRARGANRTNLWQAEKILRPAVEATVPDVRDQYWMGDLMWTGSPKTEDNNWVFKPNTVEYRVSKSGELGKQIGKSKAGIAVHTFYPSLTASDQALEGLKGLDDNGEVTYLTGEMQDKPKVLVDKSQLNSAIQTVKKHADAVDKFIQDLTDMKAKSVITAMGPFITSMLEEDDIANNIVPRFLEFLGNRLSDSARAKMLGDDQDGWLYAEDGGAPGLLGIWSMWAAVTDLKMHVKTQIDDQQQGSEVVAVIDGETAHEGYVFGQGREKIKLVDRLGFSKANFSKHKVPDEEVAKKKQMPVAAFCFGRMNPPTLGHKQLMTATVAQGGKNSYIFVSSKQDPQTDPLNPEVKKTFIKKIYPSLGSYVVEDFVKTPIEAANFLYDKGFRNMIFVAGSDRLGKSKGSIEKILQGWNSGPIRSTDHARGPEGREFVNIEFVSSGDRDPDAGGVQGISGSLARKLAAQGNESGFQKATGVGPDITVAGNTLYRAVREGMGIRDPQTESKENPMTTRLLKEFTEHLEEIIGTRLNEMFEMENEYSDEEDDFDSDEPEATGFKQAPMFDQLGKVLDSHDSPKPVNTVTTDDGETFEVNSDQARALRLLATTEKVKPDVKREFLRDIQNSAGLTDFLDQTDYHEMAHLFVKRYLH